MSTLTVTSVHCTRKQDWPDTYDEPVVLIGGQERWNGKVKKDGTVPVNVSETFQNSILLELMERDGNNPAKDKSLGRWTVYPNPSGPRSLTAKSSGYDYSVSISVS